MFNFDGEKFLEKQPSTPITPLATELVLARSTEFGDIYAFPSLGDPLNAVPLPQLSSTARQ
jgi:hypothetical protein